MGLCGAVDEHRASFEDVFRVEYPGLVRLLAPIVGSTQERVGFHKAVTVRGIRGLLEGAVACVPELEAAELG